MDDTRLPADFFNLNNIWSCDPFFKRSFFPYLFIQEIKKAGPIK